jgi:hypothetical protein
LVRLRGNWQESLRARAGAVPNRNMLPLICQKNMKTLIGLDDGAQCLKFTRSSLFMITIHSLKFTVVATVSMSLKFFKVD